MTAMRICVYCASSEYCDRVYHDAARALGRTLAEAGCTIVYGGGAVGLMGALADGALAAGGDVIGIIPRFMTEVEWQHPGVAEPRGRRGHARAQASPADRLRCGRRAARRLRHAGGIVRGDDAEAPRRSISIRSCCVEHERVLHAAAAFHGADDRAALHESASIATCGRWSTRSPTCCRRSATRRRWREDARNYAVVRESASASRQSKRLTLPSRFAAMPAVAAPASGVIERLPPIRRASSAAAFVDGVAR